MDKEPDNSEKQFISKEAFGILAFLLGIFGVHDFAARRYLYGFGHLALTFMAIVVFSSSQSSFLPPMLILGSWVWAIVENNAYQKSIDNAVTRKDATKGYLASAKTAEVFLWLAILSNIATIIMTIQSRSWVCNDTSCGWNKAFVTLLPIIVGVLMTALSLVFVSIVLARRKNLSNAQKQTKNVLYHAKATTITGIALIITVVLVILALARII
ncbi:hypothetical protein IJI28_00995 [Candidatus Saccharibacteria bacterium]|nr:hypothetical protein [Candidatus Saccharibacteria bacterium]